MMKFIQVKNKGFMLVELVVAILIIGILTSVTSISIIKSQKVSRDTQRKSDIAQIEKTLESYYSVNHKYPVSDTSGAECKEGSLGCTGVSSWQTDATTKIPIAKTDMWIVDLAKYADKLPSDPRGNNDTTPGFAPVFKGSESTYFYAYYSKSCTELMVSYVSKNCPYYKEGSTEDTKSYVVGSYYILATSLENRSDPEAISNSDIYYTNCARMKQDINYNQNALVKIKVF
ncbi:MAG: type II secretion system protein [Patescibacteria group bacterium]